MTISELIKNLSKAQKDLGDVPVVISSDSEGNNFGTFGNTSFGKVLNEEETKVVGLALYPHAEGFYDACEAIDYTNKQTK